MASCVSIKGPRNPGTAFRSELADCFVQETSFQVTLGILPGVLPAEPPGLSVLQSEVQSSALAHACPMVGRPFHVGAPAAAVMKPFCSPQHVRAVMCESNLSMFQSLSDCLLRVAILSVLSERCNRLQLRGEGGMWEILSRPNNRRPWLQEAAHPGSRVCSQGSN